MNKKENDAAATTKQSFVRIANGSQIIKSQFNNSVRPI